MKRLLIVLTLLCSLNLIAKEASFNELNSLPIGCTCPPCQLEIRVMGVGVMSMKRSLMAV